MLSDAFLDWWFAPWEYAADAEASAAAWPQGAPVQGAIGARDAYRQWCQGSGIAAELPRELQPGWHVAAGTGAAGLVGTARLFGGLLAVRTQERSLLAGLSVDEHRWCAGVASTQPLASLLKGAAPASVEAFGLAELAWRLDYGFAGLWPRLRLLLDADLGAQVDTLLRHGQRDVVALEAGAARAQRCWQMCRQRSGRA